MRLGHHAELLDEASRVLPQLSPPDLAVQRRELLRCITLCGSEIGAFDVALDAAQQLAHDSRTADDTEATLTASYSLAVCLERMGDSWQAQRLLREALAGHEPAEPSRPLLVAANAVCAMAIGMVHRLRGASTEADLQAALQGGREHGELALRLLAHVNDPVYEIAVPGNLGEVLLLQGHLDEARSLLQRSLDLALTRGLHAYAWRVQTSMADWMLAVGQPLQADRPHWICWAGWAPTARSTPRFAPTTPSTAPAARSACSSRPCTTWKCLQTWSGDAPRANCGRSLSSSSRTPRFSAPAPRPNGDQLTGLENRRHLARRCAELLPQAARDGAPLSLALLDLDDFEKVNDPHGHAVGDQVLVALAQLLRENTRAGDVLTRHGGEEFVIVLPGMPIERAREACERLRERIQDPEFARLAGLPAGLSGVLGTGAGRGPTVSIGVSSAPPHDMPLLLQRADEALYRAKREGRNRVACSEAPVS